MAELDFYSPRVMAGVIEKTPARRTFFRDRFFNQVRTFATDTVYFEFLENKRRLAPYVNPRIGSEALERDTYEVRSFTVPYIGIHRVISPDTLNDKLVGEVLWNSGETPASRAAKLAAQDILDLKDSIVRREEYMCARLKQDGMLKFDGNGVNSEFDLRAYGFSGITEVAAADAWDEDADVLGQLSDMAVQIRKDGSENPNMLIMGRDAANAVLKNKTILKLLDNRRVEMGEIRPERIENGVSYLGHIAAPGVDFDLYCYEEWVPVENAGTTTLEPLIDPETVIMQSSNERNMMLYGAVTLNDDSGTYHTYQQQYIPDKWSDRHPPQTFIALYSRPLPVPVDLTSWATLKYVVNGKPVGG